MPPSLSLERRVQSLEQVAMARFESLPHRVWFEQGHLRFVHLTDAERDELMSILERAYNDHGFIDPDRLSPEQRDRAVDLVHKEGEGYARKPGGNP